MFEPLIFLLAIEAMGLFAFPIVFGLFSRLPDRGAMLAKPLVLLLCTYVFWMIGHFGGVAGSRATVFAIVGVLAALFVFLLHRHGDEIVPWVRRHWRVLVAGEAVFLAAYGIWLMIVAQSPAITDTEKPMDFAFLNAVLQADTFPPEDPWLAGNPISYYYFGHLMVGFLTKLTGISSAFTFNLGPPLVAAMTAGGVFSLVYNLVRLGGGSFRAGVVFALLGPLLVVFIGSLEGVLELFHVRGWGSPGFWQAVAIPGLDGSGGGGFFPDEWLWWWRASRILTTFSDGMQVDAAITEFPFFIFLLGDLHAHALSLPFLVLNLAMALSLSLAPPHLDRYWSRLRWWEPVVTAVVLGALAFINLWDFPVFAGILGAVMLVKAFGDYRGAIVPAVASAMRTIVPVVGLAVLLYLPFYLTVEGRIPLILPLRDVSTRPLIFGLIWGLFLVICGAWLLAQLWRLPAERRGSRNRGRWVAPLLAIGVTLAPFLVWALVRLVISPFDGGAGDGALDVLARLVALAPLLLLIGVAFYGALARAVVAPSHWLVFPLTVLGLGLYLLIGVELFYLDDLFFKRLNTVFKAYFQAWLLLGVASAVGAYYLWAWYGQRPSLGVRVSLGALGGLVGVLLVASLYYPVGAALDRAKVSDAPATLDGLAFLEKHSPAEYQAIRWMREEAEWGRVVEAVGPDYSEYSRISSHTGYPTLLGWPTHEEHWRGGLRPQQGRRADVERIYTSTDVGEVESLLAGYGVRYVVVGPRERDTYPGLEVSGLESLMTEHRFPGAAPVTVYEWCGLGTGNAVCSQMSGGAP